MKTNILRTSCFVLAAAAFAATQSPAAETHAESAESAESTPSTVSTPSTPSSAVLFQRHGASIVEVAWFLQVDGELRPPPTIEPYCDAVFCKDPDDLIEEARPVPLPGFVLAPDRVLTADPMLRTACVARVEIRVPDRPGEPILAHPVASYPDRHALLLATETPIPGAKPLEFAPAGRTPDKLLFLTVARDDDGLLIAELEKGDPTDRTFYPESKLETVGAASHALVLGTNGAPVGVTFRDELPIDPAPFAPPADWTSAAADAGEREAADLERALARSILPVFVRLDPRAQEEGGGGGRYSFDEIDLWGVVLAGDRVLVPTPLAENSIARLDKIEATLADGAKAKLSFVGALKDQDAIVASFEGGALPAGVEAVRLAEEPVAAWRLRPLLEADVEVHGDAVRVRARRFLPGFEAVRGGAVAIETETDRAPVFSPDGRLVQLRVERRRDSGDTAWSGERLAALAAGREPFDPEIVPRTGKDRQRTAWFGVETQNLSKEVAREKKALGWIGDRYGHYSDGPSTSGALVSHVYPGSPAAEAGVQEGDILLYARSPDGATRRGLEAGSYYSRYYDDDDRSTPWPTIGNGVDAAFGSFGIGATVVVEWLRDGALRSAELAVRPAPPHFRTATRARAKDLGLIVADATFEVREYFKLEEGETGVVVTKCKHGSPAAIAGLRPYELVTKLDGEPVADARGFLEMSKGLDSFTLTVRRLTETRIVRISRKAAAPAGDAPEAETAEPDNEGDNQ